MRIELRKPVLAGLAMMALCAGSALGQQPGPTAQELEPTVQALRASDWGFPAGRGGAAYVSDLRDQDYSQTDVDPSWILRMPRTATVVDATAPRPIARPVSSSLANLDDNSPPDPNSFGAGNGAADQSNPADSDNSSGSASCGCEKSSDCGCKGGDSCDCGCDGGCDCDCDDCDCDCDCCEEHHCLPLIKCEECCPLECCEDDVCRLFDCCCLECNDTSITGWIEGGIMGNGRDTFDRYNGPVVFPDRNGEGQLNQFYGVIERTAPEDNCGCFVGGRVDMFWGSDFWFTTAAGLDGTSVGNVPRWGNDSDLYGAAMPQLYAETTFDDLQVKWGHFYTIIGYEVVPAIGNFFYSHAYTHQYGEPFTHTGILASQPAGDNWTAYYGIDNGWDTFNANSRANFLGGVTYSQDDWGSLAFAIQTGDESINGPGAGPFANRTMYSLVWTRNWTSRLTYVLEHDCGVQDRQPVQEENAEWYGINQYLFYKLNCCWTAGARFEWFRDDDGYRVTGLRPGNAIAGAKFPGNFYEVTLGANWKPNANFALRPEVRWDWYHGASPSPGIDGPYNDGLSNDQFVFGLDAIFQF